MIQYVDEHDLRFHFPRSVHEEKAEATAKKYPEKKASFLAGPERTNKVLQGKVARRIIGHIAILKLMSQDGDH